MSIPQSTVWVCSDVPLTNKYDHTLYFSDWQDQYSYFFARRVKTFSAYTYLRKSWKLKLNATMEEARKWSYLYFYNGTTPDGTQSKTYYYFINQIEYINDSTVELSLELDVIQTYMFDWELRPCYIERQHYAGPDTIYDNRVDEGLDVGDTYVARKIETINLSDNIHIITASTIDLNKLYIQNTNQEILGGLYERLFGAFQLTACPLTNGEEMATLLRNIAGKGKADAVFTMWEFPGELLVTDNGDFEDGLFNKYVSGTKSLTHIPEGPGYSIGNYRPKNAKVLGYPYRFMYVTNNEGSSAVYKYEDFDITRGAKFLVQGNIAPDGIVKLTPCNHKNMTQNLEESISIGNYPICAWNNDTYKLWLAQNQNTNNFSLLGSGLKVVGGLGAMALGISGVASGAGAGAGAVGIGTGVSMITSGASDIASQLAQRADRDIQPPQARGTYNGSYNLSKGIKNFEIIHKSITEEQAKIIDNYFTMYGYAVRAIGTPNINVRPKFTYVKTVGSNIGGKFCVEDKQAINAIFDKGITFWTDHERFCDYDVDNDFVKG